MYNSVNLLQGMTIVSSDVFKRVVDAEWPCTNSGDRLQVRAPDGYLFTVENSASDGSMAGMIIK